ncbi:hypothetical protein RJ639_009614 [Escallonia herrerae]|uniref:GAG-pre-integrase domain-containing protein n=1 Tax=Escallonia herrerae TaxID=1293975 RepID=A0AA89AQ43_9ASTE|nr:hypothetical protein RJ639_009614 [Escallonia herrerae]
MVPNTSTKYDLEKFDGSNDFSLWRMKMRAVLIQQGLLKALKGKQGLPDTMSDDEKEDMLERAHSAMLLTVTRAAAAASSSDIDSDATKLWHMRLGHMSERGMDVLSKQGLLGSKKIEKEKVELEVRAPDSLPIIPTDEDDGSYSTEKNEESQEHHVAESIEVEKPVTYKEAIKSTESVDMMTKHILEIKFKHCLDLISISSI